MKNNSLVRRAAIAAAFAAAACSAQAQGAGTWFGGVGVTRVDPDVSSGVLSPPAAPNTTVDVRADTQPTLFVGRMLTDHWSVELPIGAGFKHELVGTGGIAGVGRIGTVRVLPITVFAQYRFLPPTSRWRPYVMLGVTYAHFHGERGSATLNGVNPINPPGGTQLDVESRFGLTPGLGVTFHINDRWFVDAQYAKSFLKTTTTLSSGQKIDTKLDPHVMRLAAGMRF